MPNPVERAFPPLPAMGDGGRIVAAPFQFVTTGEDNLRVTVVNAAAGCRVAVQGRRIDSQGTVLPLGYAMSAPADRTPVTQIFPLGIGAMVNVAVYAVAGAPMVGQTFVIVQIVRGREGGTELLGTLLQGYVTTTQGLGWPGSPIVSSTDGEPALRVIRGTTPAAGNGWTETVPTGARWEVLAVRFNVAASAAVVTRYISVYADEGGRTPWILASPRQLIASEVRIYSFAVGLEYQSHDYIGVAQHVLPASACLKAGATLNGVVYYQDPLDQCSAPDFIVREWLEVP